jgi:hypothetical protein
MEEERGFHGVTSLAVEEMTYEDGPLLLVAYERVRAASS